MITGVIIEKIEARVGDQGLGLQTGCVVKVFSCGKADKPRFWVGLDTRGLSGT